MKDHYSSPARLVLRCAAYLRDSGGPSQDQSVGQQESEMPTAKYSLTLVKVFVTYASGGSTIGRDNLWG
jgi:hypothetical protein